MHGPGAMLVAVLAKAEGTGFLIMSISRTWPLISGLPGSKTRIAWEPWKAIHRSTGTLDKTMGCLSRVALSLNHEAFWFVPLGGKVLVHCLKNLTCFIQKVFSYHRWYVNHLQFELYWPQGKFYSDECRPNCQYPKTPNNPKGIMPWIEKERRLQWNHFVYR